ncbi:MAG: signal recognition particle protein Srp54 [Candidatus Bathyarchaeia archaeon]
MSALENLGKSLREAIKKLLGKSLVDEEVVKELIRDLQRVLLQSDVNVKLVFELSKRVEERALKEVLPPGISRKEHIIKVLYDELTKILGEKPAEIDFAKEKKKVIMLVGIQGSGKTTGAVKIARFYQKKGLKTALICADTYMLGAYPQLQQLASKVGIPVYWEENSKPEKIALHGKDKFIKEGYDLIIIDTAGRHKNENELMEEMKRLVEVVKPDEVMLVIDGTIGQQAFAHAEAFNKSTSIGSIYVTKLDGSARGGGALSAIAATGAKIKFIGTGENIEDIEPFVPSKFVGRLLGMGDLEALIEKVKEVEEGLTKKEAKAILEGKFTLKDLYNQMNTLKRMGPLKKLWGMLPGGVEVPEDQIELIEKKLSAWRVIIQSMTKEEVEDPKIIDSSRIKRIARGSGRSEKEVKELISQYFNMKRMIKTLKRRKALLMKKIPFPS